MEFRLHLLDTITSNFSDENKVGSGGYGDVYKGVYNGKEIAVKKLHPLQGLDDKAFNSAFHNLRKVEHKNVVPLLGYCYESRKNYIQQNGELSMATRKERILCFEYMEGESLDKHIEDEYCRLDWHTCYQIIKGTCDGLNHLHGAYEKPIFHPDLKPSNILLYKNRTAKIADLGLSRLLTTTETHKTQMANVKGTLGFMPPEYIDGGYISKRYDVFSLGVIILKIMAGNKGHSRCYEMSPEQLTKHVIENWEGRLQETSRHSSHERDIIQVQKCIEIAVKCVEKDWCKRPLIKDIVRELHELEAEIGQDEAPQNMECDDTLLVQSARVGEDSKFSPWLNKGMVVDTMKVLYSDPSKDLIDQVTEDAGHPATHDGEKYPSPPAPVANIPMYRGRGVMTWMPFLSC